MRAVWGVVLIVLTALGVTASAVVLDATSGGGPQVDKTGTEPVGDDGAIDLAGSGTNLPLTRLLAEAFNERTGGELVRVHESIGSRGGIRAVLDGAVDVGLVSRPLDADEQALGVRLLPYARVEVVFAANATVPESGLSVADLFAIYRSERTTWADGRPIVLFLREATDSGQTALEAVLPGYAEVSARARNERFEVLYRDIDMQDALVSVPGAVGLFDRGAITAQGLSLRVLPLGEGVAAAKVLAFAVLAEPTGPAADFVAFVYSDAGRAVVAESGYEPIPRAAP